MFHVKHFITNNNYCMFRNSYKNCINIMIKYIVNKINNVINQYNIFDNIDEYRKYLFEKFHDELLNQFDDDDYMCNFYAYDIQMSNLLCDEISYCLKKMKCDNYIVKIIEFDDFVNLHEFVVFDLNKNHSFEFMITIENDYKKYTINDTFCIKQK